MYIEKNIFDNVFYTVIDVKGKTKDNPKARADMKNICKRPLLKLVEVSSEKFLKPKASYTLTREQLKDVCEWYKNLKFSDDYISNLARCINVKDYRLYGLKSHDCHIFMQRLLLLAWHDLLLNILSKYLLQSQLFNHLLHQKKEKEKIGRLHVKLSFEPFITSSKKKKSPIY